MSLTFFYVILDRGILYATIPEFLTGTNIKGLFTFIYFVSFSVITLAQHVSWSLTVSHTTAHISRMRNKVILGFFYTCIFIGYYGFFPSI